MDFILLGSFVEKRHIDTFKKILTTDFKIKEKSIFLFEIENNENEYMVTFKINKNKRSDIAKYFVGINTINLHVKNGCIFSINALNKLIENEVGDINIRHSEYSINWDFYKNKLLILNNGELMIKNIEKIDNIS